MTITNYKLLYVSLLRTLLLRCVVRAIGHDVLDTFCPVVILQEFDFRLSGTTIVELVFDYKKGQGCTYRTATSYFQLTNYLLSTVVKCTCLDSSCAVDRGVVAIHGC